MHNIKLIRKDPDFFLEKLGHRNTNVNIKNLLDLDKENRKMSLGVKQMTPDPWENIETNFPVGSKHNVKIRNFTNFGIFVELAEGVDGLLHISDLSWTKKIKHPAEFTQVDAQLEVVVLDIEKSEILDMKESGQVTETGEKKTGKTTSYQRSYSLFDVLFGNSSGTSEKDIELILTQN